MGITIQHTTNMTKAHQSAIDSRNEWLKLSETELRNCVIRINNRLVQQNESVVGTEAENLTKSQIYQLVADRLSEVALGVNTYRY